MGGYIPTEQELVDVLCRIRETDWEAAVRRSNDIWSTSGCCTVRDGYKDFIKNFKNLRDISQEYMGTPEQWQYYTFSFILGQIADSPAKDQRLLLELVNRYRETAREKLLDVVWGEWYIAVENMDSMVRGTPECLAAETLEQRLKDKFYHIERDSLSGLDMLDITENVCGNWWEFLGDSKRREMTSVDEKSLVWRILVAQQLIKLIGEAIGQVQTQTPAPAEDQAKKNSRPGAAKRPAIEFIKERVQCDPKFTPLQQMKQGKHGDFKNLKNALWELFLSESPAMKDRITKGTFSDYVGNAVSELLPDR